MTRLVPAVLAFVFLGIGLIPYVEEPRGDFEVTNIIALVLAAVIFAGEVFYAKTRRDPWQ